MTEDLFDRVQEFLKKNLDKNYGYSKEYLSLSSNLNSTLEKLIEFHFGIEVWVVLGEDKNTSLLVDDSTTWVYYGPEKFKNKAIFLGHIAKDFIFGCSNPGA